MRLVNFLAHLLLPAAAFAVAAGAGAQDIYGDLQAPLAGRVYGTSIHTADAEELRYVVLQRLTDRYAATHGIVVTPAEQQAYAKSMQDGLRKDRAQLLARREELTRQLAAHGLTEAQRKKPSADLDAVTQTLAALAADANAGSAEDKQAREQIASAFIRQWKINQALYRQYDGRIVFQQGGPEPLDAYRRFLQERQAGGDFAIYAPRMEEPFWRYDLTDSMHSFYARGSKEETGAFETPWWSPK